MASWHSENAGMAARQQRGMTAAYGGKRNGRQHHDISAAASAVSGCGGSISVESISINRRRQ